MFSIRRWTGEQMELRATNPHYFPLNPGCLIGIPRFLYWDIINPITKGSINHLFNLNNRLGPLFSLLNSSCCFWRCFCFLLTHLQLPSSRGWHRRAISTYGPTRSSKYRDFPTRWALKKPDINGVKSPLMGGEITRVTDSCSVMYRGFNSIYNW